MVSVLCGVLIDGTGKAPKKNQVIRIEEDKIISIIDREKFEAEAGERVIDLSEYSVTPGFVDCHDHLCLDAGDEAAQCAESDVWLSIVSVANAKKIVESGITTMRDCGEKSFIDVEVKRAIEKGIIPGPRLLTAGYPICRTGGHAYHLGREANGADDVRKAVREQLKMGVDLIKIMASGGMSTKGSIPDGQELTDEEIHAAIDEAHRAGRKVSAHIHGGSALRAAVEASVDSIEHGGMLKDDDLQLMAEKGTYLVSTAGLAEVILADPDVPKFYHKKVKDSVERRIKIISKAREFGVKIAVGNDTNHAHMDMELKALTESGFTNMEAIVAATKNGADLCGILDQVGTLEEGKLADLVAFEGNPLEDIRTIGKPMLVMKGGHIEFEKRKN